MESDDPLLALLGQLSDGGGPSSLTPATPHQPLPQPAEASTSNASKRVQGAGCDTCRLRKVKCDLHIKIVKSGGSKETLKILSPVDLGITCTNCETRGIRCTTAWQKAGKKARPRTGNRLQQALSTYGASEAGSSDGTTLSPLSVGNGTRQPAPTFASATPSSNEDIWRTLLHSVSTAANPLSPEALASLAVTSQAMSPASSDHTLFGLRADDGLGRAVLGQELTRCDLHQPLRSS